MLDIDTLPADWRAALSRIPVEILLALSGKCPDDLKSADDLLSRKQAAAYLSLSASYLNKLNMRGIGPRVTRLGERMIRYKRGDLDAWRETNGGMVNERKKR